MKIGRRTFIIATGAALTAACTGAPGIDAATPLPDAGGAPLPDAPPPLPDAGPPPPTVVPRIWRSPAMSPPLGASGVWSDGNVIYQREALDGGGYRVTWTAGAEREMEVRVSPTGNLVTLTLPERGQFTLPAIELDRGLLRYDVRAYLGESVLSAALLHVNMTV